MIPLSQQLACARRELARRQQACKRMVIERRMTQDQADLEIETWKGIVATVERAWDLEEVSREMRKGVL